MKKFALTGYINRVVLGVSFAALLTLGMSTARVQPTDAHRTTVTAYHAVQVADGSESNGGKGGKGGAKRASIA